MIIEIQDYWREEGSVLNICLKNDLKCQEQRLGWAQAEQISATGGWKLKLFF